MLRLICGCTVTERKVTAKVGELLELEPVSLVVKNGRLRWSGHVECKDDASL